MGMKFTLIPFEEQAPFFIVGEWELLQHEIQVLFRVIEAESTRRGPEISLPRLMPPHARKRCDELWKSTCFELFIGVRGDPRYFELNVSPSGDWNLYSFTGYREGMRPVIDAKPPMIEPRSDGIHLTLNLGFLPAEAQRDPELGIAAVLDMGPEGTLYYALKHPGNKPDFHWREAFSQILT